jgi:carboxylesterase type B
VSVYKNIRFANPPTGNLRFRLPDTQLPKTPGIQDGNVPDLENDCISSAPPGAPFPPFNGTTWGREDCLFLDVYVPDNVKPDDSVPVLQWFTGSAFAFGSKEMFLSPLGLFDAMDEDSKFILVANNYRSVNEITNCRSIPTRILTIHGFVGLACPVGPTCPART